MKEKFTFCLLLLSLLFTGVQAQDSEEDYVDTLRSLRTLAKNKSTSPALRDSVIRVLDGFIKNRELKGEHLDYTRDTHLQILEIAKRHKDIVRLADSYLEPQHKPEGPYYFNNRKRKGLAFNSLGYIREARETYMSLLEKQPSHNHKRRIMCGAIISNLYYLEGKFPEAVQTAKLVEYEWEAFSIKGVDDKLGDLKRKTAVAMWVAGYSLFSQERVYAGLRFLRKSIKLFKSLSPKISEDLIKLRKTELAYYAAKRKYTKITESIETSLDEYGSKTTEREKAELCIILSTVYQDLKKYDESSEYINDAIKFAQGDKILTMRAYDRKAELLLEKQDFKGAINAVEDALNIDFGEDPGENNTEREEYTISASGIKVIALGALYQETKDISHLEKAEELIRKINKYFSEEYATIAIERASFDEAAYLLPEWAESLNRFAALTEADTRKLFELSEPYRLGFLQLRKKIKALSEENIEVGSLIRKKNELSAAIRKAELMAEFISGEYMLQSNLLELYAKERLLNSEIKEAMKSRGTLLQLQGQNLDELTEKLDDKTVILFLHSAGSHNKMLLSLVRENGFETKSSSLTLREYQEHVHTLGVCISSSAKLKKLSEPSLALYNGLFKPFEDVLPKNIIIVTDNLITPFPVNTLLRTIPEKAVLEANDFQSADFIIKHHNCTFSLTGEPLAESEVQQEFTTDWVGFAPVFADNNEFVGVNNADKAGRFSALKIQNGRVFFDPLKASGEEVTVAADLLSEKGFKTEICLEDKATESAFYKHLKTSRILHLSTHSLADREEFQNSFIAFSAHPDSSFISIEDLAFRDELRTLKLDNELLIMSSCESGKGFTMIGRGKETLARAALEAGVHQVIASFWKVLDNETAMLFESFYKHYRDSGTDAAEALRLAQLNFLENPEYSNHPLTWAAFSVFCR